LGAAFESGDFQLVSDREYNAELILDARATLGEGALWDVDRHALWWVDIEQGQVHCFDPDSNTNQTYDVGQRVGTVVTRASGGLMLAVENGFASFDLETSALQIVGDPESDQPGNRFNDGKCDPAGRFWAGTMSMGDARAADGALYCLNTAGQIQKHLDGVRVSNGLVWTADRSTMYYIDSRTRRVDAFDYENGTGQITNRRPVVEVEPELGGPDGMAIDTDDNVWVALFRGSAVACFDPRNGKQLARIGLPASRVTSCAFGGPNLQDLYITTARIGLSEDEQRAQPHAGGVFCARVEARGVPNFAYGG
jgi:sugar lactone lactonase YvrE|tara:strand:- start:1767 stop:2693 length:927 start_codon:yes stop_codon:yes gene_type:complete